MQMFLYFFNYEKDKKALKILIVLLWAFDTANEILLLVSMWPVLILRWGDLSGLSVTQPALLHHGWVAGVVSVGVQFFFIYRIYKFGGKRWRGVLLLVPLSLWQIVGVIPYDVWVFRSDSLALLAAPRMISFEISLRATSVLVDITIVACLTYLLAKTRHTGLAFSDRMIYRIIVLTVNTGACTAVVALVDFALIAAYPHGLYFCVLEFPLSSLYINALLANLNIRQYLRDAAIDSDRLRDTGSIVLQPLSTNGLSPSFTNPSNTVRIETSKVTEISGDYLNSETKNFAIV